MGQTRGDVFRYDVNQIVDVDTSIFLETPSRDALIKLSSNSGLTRDPSAPQELSQEQRDPIAKDPELLEVQDKSPQRFNCTLWSDPFVRRHCRLL